MYDIKRSIAWLLFNATLAASASLAHIVGIPSLQAPTAACLLDIMTRDPPSLSKHKPSISNPTV